MVWASPNYVTCASQMKGHSMFFHITTQLDDGLFPKEEAAIKIQIYMCLWKTTQYPTWVLPIYM